MMSESGDTDFSSKNHAKLELWIQARSSENFLKVTLSLSFYQLPNIELLKHNELSFSSGHHFNVISNIQHFIDITKSQLKYVRIDLSTSICNLKLKRCPLI